MNLAEFEAWCARKAGGKQEKPKAFNSTLAAPSKPIAKVGAKGNRQQKADKLTREYIFQRDEKCVVCLLHGEPYEHTRKGPDEWAHVHGRNTHKGVDVRNHPAYSVRLCQTHHDWHHKKGTTHALGIRVTPYGQSGRKWKQTFTVDGIAEESRTVEVREKEDV